MFEDDSVHAVEGSAWVISTDPSYAPQTTNVVTLWDDLYNTWLEHLDLQPEIYNEGSYQDDFKPCFDHHVLPILKAASLQKWNTSLPPNAVARHDDLVNLPPSGPGFMMMNFIRNPNDETSQQTASPLMPLALGDLGKSFLSLTTTQYFFMQQWSAKGCATDSPPSLGAGEALDRTILFNCLGGRFSPGIEMSFIVRDINLYRQDWKDPAVGPFRINMEQFDYSRATPDAPFLGVGYIPFQPHPVQPGDMVKFMAIPWHTDYNSCATHLPNPNPGGDLSENNIEAATGKNGTINTILYSSWPAQRPVAVYTYDDVHAHDGQWPVRPRYSVRGEGTAAMQHAGPGFDRPAMNVGRYQDRKDFLSNWSRIGVVIQGPAIHNYPDGYRKDLYLEVESQFEQDESNLVEYWRNTVIDRLYPPQPPKPSE
ncbi:MAG: hypothetical protein ETSY2_47420 [Candidatus Entotheonella gemina]|uniref:L-lysine epsilon oxidase C-terminal domain-containing protein n=1 Tax=Candidatus Entotheonella gemina TaxID=1429439 RepID=W4LD98_9BACT|nr:MAG: hypothetical protein ETSY2_47420 [Candidatus Entotheonella gemina]